MKLSFMNPNTSSTSKKDGHHYYVKMEMLKDEWDEFNMKDLTGMVMECDCEITHEAEPREQVERKYRGVKLSGRTAMWCKQEDFQEYAAWWWGPIAMQNFTSAEAAAKRMIYKRCNIESRAELGTDKEAADKARQIYRDFEKWQKLNGE